MSIFTQRRFINESIGGCTAEVGDQCRNIGEIAAVFADGGVIRPHGHAAGAVAILVVLHQRSGGRTAQPTIGRHIFLHRHATAQRPQSAGVILNIVQNVTGDGHTIACRSTHNLVQRHAQPTGSCRTADVVDFVAGDGESADGAIGGSRRFCIGEDAVAVGADAGVLFRHAVNEVVGERDIREIIRAGSNINAKVGHGVPFNVTAVHRHPVGFDDDPRCTAGHVNNAFHRRIAVGAAEVGDGNARLCAAQRQ